MTDERHIAEYVWHYFTQDENISFPYSFLAVKIVDLYGHSSEWHAMPSWMVILSDS